MFLKHAGESQEEWEDGKARAQGARSGGDTNQFSKILGSGNKEYLGNPTIEIDAQLEELKVPNSFP